MKFRRNRLWGFTKPITVDAPIENSTAWLRSCTCASQQERLMNSPAAGVITLVLLCSW
jgi:hypothetical protein